MMGQDVNEPNSLDLFFSALVISRDILEVRGVIASEMTAMAEVGNVRPSAGPKS